VNKYPLALQPTLDSPQHRALYYSLNLTADRNLTKILDCLDHLHNGDNTIVVFTSDHGDQIGAHKMFQKWYNAYEESIKIPLVVRLPKYSHNTHSSKNTTMLTSSIDVLPTLLGLAHVDVEKIQKKLKKTHNEVRSLVGRDLTPLIKNRSFVRANEPILFTTDDDALKGKNQTTQGGEPYKSVVQPNHIQTLITLVPQQNGPDKLYKYSRYYDNPQFWTNPGVEDVITDSVPTPSSTFPNVSIDVSVKLTKKQPVSDEYEMYCLTDDPNETQNLANPAYQTVTSSLIQTFLDNLLRQTVFEKLLIPTSGMVPGIDLYQPVDNSFPRPS